MRECLVLGALLLVAACSLAGPGSIQPGALSSEPPAVEVQDPADGQEPTTDQPAVQPPDQTDPGGEPPPVDPPVEDPGEHSSIVFPGADGRLAYVPDANGNVVPDFSRAGYLGGGKKLPAVPGPLVAVAPGEGDDAARIQKAIDEVAQMPPGQDGFRGVVQLEKGRYEVAGSLFIKQSGVVLRGMGAGDDGTEILATGTSPRELLVIGGGSGPAEVSGSRREIADPYVPAGAKSFTLQSVEGLKVGDPIVVLRPSTESWIRELGMDRIPPRPDGTASTQWKAGGYDLRFERVIEKIEGNKITIDAPVMNALDQKFGGGFVYRYNAARISRIGIERIRFDSEYKVGEEDRDEAHAKTAIQINVAENLFVRAVTCLHFVYSCVAVSGGAKYVTVEDSSNLDPVSEITGGRRYSFNVNGQYVLVQRCHSRNGRHDYVTGARVAGPNVFLDCTAEKTHSDIGPHHRWAVGSLYDNVRGGQIAVQDRQWMGSGHGWSGAQQVFWNCAGSELACQDPPTALNWAIGFAGKKSEGAFPPRPACHWELPNKTVSPRSLYLRQLRDRLGLQAVTDISR